MDRRSKRRGWPSPYAEDMKPIAFNLEECLEVENIYRPNLLVIQEELKPWEVTVKDRDQAVNILRLLRIWFDVPHNVFFSATTYLDLFLSKIKVQEKYLSCLTVSCFYVAAEKKGCKVNANQLIAISGKFSTNDFNRMVKIVNDKLKLDNNDNNRITTSADFLLLYIESIEYMMEGKVNCEINDVLEKEQLLARLEFLLAHNNCAFFRSSVLALVLLKLQIESILTRAISNKSMHFIGELIQMHGLLRELQLTCKIKAAELVNCNNNASNVMKQYDNQSNKQRATTIVRGGRHRNYHIKLSTIEEKTKSPS